VPVISHLHTGSSNRRRAPPTADRTLRNTGNVGGIPALNISSGE